MCLEQVHRLLWPDGQAIEMRQWPQQSAPAHAGNGARGRPGGQARHESIAREPEVQVMDG